MSKQTRRSALIVGLGVSVAMALPNCTSSTFGGNSGNLTSCKNPSPALSACNECEESSCASQAAAVESQCSAVSSCEASCDCSDQTCLSACQSSPSSGCQSVALQLASCGLSSCSAHCGASSLDGGS